MTLPWANTMPEFDKTTAVAPHCNLPKGIRDQIFRFSIVGVIGFIFNALMVEMLAKYIGPIWAQAFAFPVASSITWWLNRRYSFGASRHAWYQEWLRYIGANLFGWLANNGVYFSLILQFPLAYHRPALAVAVGSIVGMFFNFAASKWLVFR